MPLFQSAPNSLCILRLSAIGDVCHAIAVVQAIQKEWPKTKITWIVGKIEAQLIHDLPNIEVVIFEKQLGIKGMMAVWKQLKNHHFDALLHMQLALRASLLTLGIKAKYKIGFNRQRAKEGQWLFTNRKIDDTSTVHVLDSFYSFIEYIGVPRTPPAWDIPLSNDDFTFIKKITNSIPQNKKTVIIPPSSSKDEKNWLTERYAQLADWLTEQGYQVILCGSPTERELKLSQEIENLTQSAIINITGKTTLKQLTALLKHADLVVSPDSGPAHIATTQNTPVVGLYGYSDPKRTAPYNCLDYAVSVYDKHAEKQYNTPVSELKWGSKVKGAHVMEDITLDMVKKAINLIMNIN